jgi:rubrerythrin
MSGRPLPDIAAILAPLLGGVPPVERPLLLAIAERMAADRYRGWASEVDDADARAGLRACADREDEIATRVEGVYPDAAAVQERLRAAHPDLASINAEIFAGRPLAEQFTIQAGGERLGAATWRTLAAATSDAGARAAFLACAPLEEASAEFLEALLERDLIG